MNLVLIDDMGKFVVKCLNGEFEFVHNNVDGSNWFNQKTLASMFGVSVQSVSNRLNTYMKRIKANKNNSRYPESFVISLKVKNSKPPVKFYNFKAVTWFAHVLNTQEAFDMLEWIDSSLNTMFNVATGKTDLDTKMNKLVNMMEVEELKSDKYLGVYKELIKFDEESANNIYNKYKISKNNAFNCHELLMAKRDWDKRYEVVRDTIEPKRDYGSKQLLLF